MLRRFNHDQWRSKNMQDNNSFLTLFLQPVAAYLADDTVSEILINGPGRVYIE